MKKTLKVIYKIIGSIVILTVILLAIGLFYTQSNCSCWENTFEKQGQNYEQAVSKLERKFINKGYLKNSDPESYWALADSIILKNDYYVFDVKVNPIFINEFGNCFVENLCINEEYSKIRSLNNKLFLHKDLNPEKAFKDFKQVFKKKDLESNLIKHYFLTFYSSYFG